MFSNKFTLSVAGLTLTTPALVGFASGAPDTVARLVAAQVSTQSSSS